jgi:hypothetical protein
MRCFTRSMAAWLLMLCSLVTGASAQNNLEVTMSPALLADLDSVRFATGAAARVLVKRTNSLAVGGEVGYFGECVGRGSRGINHPLHGSVTEDMVRRLGLAYAAMVARFMIADGNLARSYVKTTTGLYRVRESYESVARDSIGRLVWYGRHASRSSSTHPGVSAGILFEWGSLPLHMRGNLGLQAHAVLGVESWLKTLVVVSIGVTARVS